MRTITQGITKIMMKKKQSDRNQRGNKLTKVILAGAVISTTSLFVAANSNAIAASGWPEVISSMPVNTQVAICADSFITLDKHWNQFVKAVELEQFGMQKPSDILTMMGPAMEYVDLDKSGGVAIVKNRWDEDTPPFLVFMPVSNYEGWVESLSTGVENGLNLLDMNSDKGEQWYAKSSGSYAVMSINDDLLSTYTPDADSVSKFQSLAGTLGSDVVARNDVVTIIDFEGLDEIVKPGIEGLMEQMESNMGMMGAMGGNADQMRQAMAMYTTVIDLALEEAQSMVMGARSGSKGVVFDFALQWKPDSTMRKFFEGTENPKNLLTKFDKRPFLLAFSMDLSGCDFEGLLASIMERLPEDMRSIGNNPATATTMELIKKADGLATVIYPSPAGIMGGLLNAAVTLYTGDVPAMRDAMEKNITEMNGTEQQGISFITEYAAGDVQIDDITADTYSMQMKFSPELAQANQAIGMMYGPGGIRGYIVPTEQGLLQTVSRNKVLVRKMIASLAANDGLANDEQFSAFDNMLPENPIMQGYIGIGAIVSQVAPLAGMFIQGVNFDDMTKVPPIGFAAKIADGGVQKTLVIPAPLIKAATELALQVQSQMGGGDNNREAGDDDEDAPMF